MPSMCGHYCSKNPVKIANVLSTKFHPNKEIDAICARNSMFLSKELIMRLSIMDSLSLGCANFCSFNYVNLTCDLADG